MDTIFSFVSIVKTIVPIVVKHNPPFPATSASLRLCENKW